MITPLQSFATTLDPALVEKGKKWYSAGMVHNVSNKRGCVWDADLIGPNKQVKVSVEIVGKDVQSSFCSCGPKLCSHVIALLFELVEKNHPTEKYYPEAVKPKKASKPPAVEKTASDLPASVERIIEKIAAKSLWNDIIKDWGQLFPGLKRQNASRRLLKRAGPLLIGIELDKITPTEYRPKLIAYSLMETTDETPAYILNQSIKDTQGAAVAITMDEHPAKHLEASQWLTEQAPIDLIGEPDTKEMVTGLIEYLETSSPENPFLLYQAVLQMCQLLFEKEHYLARALLLLQKRIPEDELNILTGGIGPWIGDIKGLTPRSIGARIENAKAKYAFWY